MEWCVGDVGQRHDTQLIIMCERFLLLGGKTFSLFRFLFTEASFPMLLPNSTLSFCPWSAFSRLLFRYCILLLCASLPHLSSIF